MFRRLVWVALAALVACNRHEEPRKPNLVVIALDTLRPDHLGCYGYSRDTSPNLDAFAKNAVVFEDAQTAAPWTAPSLLSLMTSLYPSVHGVWRFNDPGQMNEHVTTLAEVLKQHGYWTGAFTEGGYAKPQFGLKQGFDTFPLNEGDTPLKHWSNIEHVNRLPQNVDRTLKWLGEARGAPFFLFFHTYQVHGPYRPPEELVRLFRPDYEEKAEHARVDEALKALREGREISVEQVRLLLNHSGHCGAGLGDEKEELLAAQNKYGIASVDEQRMQFWRDLYDAGIRNADRELKRLLDVLDQPDLRENTVIVFVSDHGEGFGEHGVTGHGNVLHEEDLRVLFMLRAPGVAPRRVKELVRTVDVMPTVLDLLGISRGQLQLQGQSLLALLRGEPWSAAPSFSHALSKTGGEDRQWSVRDGKWRYVWDKKEQLGRLYDLDADSRELTDVAARNPKIAEAMHGKLNAQRDEDALFRKRASGPVGDYVFDEHDQAALKELGYFGNEESGTAPTDRNAPLTPDAAPAKEPDAEHK